MVQYLIVYGWSSANDFMRKSNSALQERLRREEDINMDIIESLTSAQLRTDLPELCIGDTVKVHVLIKEGSRERIQVFEGTIISKKHGGITETFTVRRISYGVGVERTFPVNSPKLAKIEVVRKGKVRRAKLYYLRDRVGKATRVKEKI